MKRKLNKQSIFLAVAFFVGCLFPHAYSAIDNGLAQLRTLVNVMETVKENYVEETKVEDLLTNAMRGLLAGLDPYSEYMDSKEYSDMKAGTKGEFGGIGIRLFEGEGYIEVSTPIPGTPAFEAGVMPKDRIMEIDGKPVADMKLDAAVDLMRGKPGTKVKITIERKKEGAEEYERLPVFTLKRAIIVPEVIYYRLLDNKTTGYIYVVDFSGHTIEKIKEAIKDLTAKGMQNLVLDLRFNPGGLLNAAVDMAGLFVGEEKLIVYTKGRKEEFYQEYRAPAKAAYPALPIALLINDGSASGSEIVAGALQDYKRAVLLGSRTYGKASVQQVIPVGDGSALRLTIARYYTPLGRLIHRDPRDKKQTGTGGIVPDVTVDAKLEDVYKNLSAYTNAIYTPGKGKEAAKDLPADTQLERAVEILSDKKKYEENLGKGIQEEK